MEKLEQVLYFVSVVAVASILLAYLSEVRPEMTFEKRMVAYHSSAVLKLLGINAEVYEIVVRLPLTEQKSAEVLSQYLKEENTSSGIELKAKKLTPWEEEIVFKYIDSLQRQGRNVYLSTATIIGVNDHVLEVDIIPECVGLMGIITVSALIIGYPGVNLKKRAIGLLISWPLMYIINVLRIVTTFAAGYYGGAEALYLTHDLLWKTVLVAWSLALWGFWLWFIVEEKTTKELIKAFKKYLKHE